MKTIRLAILMSSVLFFTSCEDDSANPIELTGDWQSKSIYVKGKLQEDISNSTWLLLKRDNVFQRNYVIGKWSLNGKNLALSPNADISVQPMSYQVVDYSGDSMTLQITLTEREYGWDFEDAEPDELITVTEMYSKKQ
ncbi:hypothetical protein [Pontibacter virosus]|uniref:Lipocalin-like protein n=1 Tax=Pontibacter virosus TaxID=1765052 RepID=A0A2U1AQ46_9BACT|nr:hypothetical protein [Pontibacter virosus]PVY38498.1 hypothetical protein C8E01_11623 [Pontibacter virosus]